MSMPPNEPQFILRRDYDRYSVLVRDAHGAYRTLLTMDGAYNWKDAAEIVLEALINVAPPILPEPDSTK
jgi:hypothetical protein